MVVYWLQQPGGSVYSRTADGYDVLKFDGMPSVFKQLASTVLGQTVELMFGDQPTGPPASVTIMRDERGVPSMVLARHGDALSFSVLNVGTKFRMRATVSLKGTEQDKPGGLLATDHVAVTLDASKSTATIDLLTDGKPATRIELQTPELDAVLAALGEARAIMRDGVPTTAPEQRSARELVITPPNRGLCCQFGFAADSPRWRRPHARRQDRLPQALAGRLSWSVPSQRRSSRQAN
jgi:hypothetical protein